MLQMGSGTSTISIASGKMVLVVMQANDTNIQFRSIGNCGSSSMSVSITPEIKAYYKTLTFEPSSYWNNGIELYTKDSSNNEVFLMNVNSGRTYSYTGRLEDATVISSTYFTIPYLNM